MEAWGADGRDGPESHVNYGREVPATVSKMFVLQLMAPCREEDGIFYQGEAARRGGCSAVCAGHLVGEGQTTTPTEPAHPESPAPSTANTEECSSSPLPDPLLVALRAIRPRLLSSHSLDGGERCMSKTWQVQDAKARFSELIETSLAEGPQIVTKRGVETAVLVAIDEWRRMEQRARPELKELLLAPEARTDALTPPRTKHRRRVAPRLE